MNFELVLHGAISYVLNLKLVPLKIYTTPQAQTRENKNIKLCLIV